MGNSDSCGKNLRGILGLSESASEAEVLLAVKTLAGQNVSASTSASNGKISLEHMLGVFDSIPSAFILTDSSLRIWYCNKFASDICRFQISELNDSYLYTAVPFLKSCDDFVTPLVESGRTDTLLRKSLDTPQGAKVFDITVSPLLCENDGGAVIRLDDVTQIEAKEERLRNAEKMEAMGTLAGGIAHDFNNILSAVSGFTEMALTGVAQGSSPYVSMQNVLSACGRAKELTGQILSFSRKSKQESHPLKMSIAVKEVLRLVSAIIPRKIKIRQELYDSESMIMAEPSDIHKVIMNLCTNAVHAMRDCNQGLISVSLSKISASVLSLECPGAICSSDMLKLSVTDTGHGMNRETIDKIFTPFFTTKKEGEGTGLGLSILKETVTRLKGDITVQSEPGRGTCFNVYLPVHASPAAPAPDLAGDHVSHLGGLRILFVDDEEILLHLSRLMLQSMAHSTVTASSSTEALELFRRDPASFDMVITDQMMPEMTGVELAKNIKSIRPEIPVILCTGYSKSVDPAAAREAGVSDMLIKPVRRQMFKEVINKFSNASGN